MKNLTHLLFVLLCICLPVAVHAQKDKDKDDDDSKYLAGAVPEVDGKVVFTKEFSIPGMSQEEIFNRMQKWMEARLKKNENNSRVVYTNPEEGQIVGTGEEWIVFSSSALSLDRTKILSTNYPWFVHPRSVQWKLKRFVSITVKEKRSIRQRNGS